VVIEVEEGEEVEEVTLNKSTIKITKMKTMITKL